MSPKDTIYQDLNEQPVPFEFNRRVVDVFPDMIKRSVPGYATAVGMTRQIARRYVTEQSRCYDLGCSLGTSMMAIIDGVGSRPCSLIGVDSSPAMLSRCQQILDREASHSDVTLLAADLRDVPIEQASLVVLNYTLQFVDPVDRDSVLKRIADGLIPGGACLLSEKVHFSDPDLSQVQVDLHHDFKRANGYSELEVAAKRSALDKVLVTETPEEHLARFKRTGFAQSLVLLQAYNFMTFLAIR